MAIDFDMLFCPYDVVFHRVIVPHEGLGVASVCARGHPVDGNRSP